MRSSQYYFGCFTTQLAIDTVKMALCFAKKKPKSLILHSDRGVQFTSKKFVEFCEQEKIIQSMSAAGCPYDNAPMERYFNTLKTELINTNQYFSTEHLQADISKFAHLWYNHNRLHSYNGYKTPFEKRFEIDDNVT